jgi:hypothetical protein
MTKVVINHTTKETLMLKDVTSTTTDTVGTRLRRRWRGVALASVVGAGAAGLLGVQPAAAATPTPVGYWLIGQNGALWSIAGAQFVTQTVAGVTGPLSSPLSASPVAAIVGIAATPDGKGYWAADATGGVYTYGDAGFYGSLPGLKVKPKTPIVGITATPDGKGYRLVSGDGGIFGFGDAGYFGSLPALKVSVADIVGMAVTSDGNGYWLVGSDGGVFGFGDAGYFGSIYDKTGAASLVPIVGITGSPANNGYLLARNDGAVFAFGNPFFGGSPLLSGVTGSPMVAISYTPDGKGYWVASSDGGVFSYGDAPFLGSVPGELNNTGLTNSTLIVGFAPTL